MKISQDIYDRYWEKGWVVVEGVYLAEEVDRIIQLAMVEGERELNENAAGYVADHAGDGTAVAVRKVHQPFLKIAACRPFVLDERLTSIVGDLIGQEPVLVGDQIFCKPPQFGSKKPYHQDNAYFQCDPADHVITAWIALDDVDQANGCLRYIEGSHKGPLLRHDVPDPDEPYNLSPPQELIDLSKEFPALVQKGGVVFHHVQTLHTSHRNTSDRWRRGYATHWASAQTTSRNDTINNAYFKRDDYPHMIRD